jgi:hypothetical protein
VPVIGCTPLVAPQPGHGSMSAESVTIVDGCRSVTRSLTRDGGSAVPAVASARIDKGSGEHGQPAEGDEARVDGVGCQQVRQAGAQVHHVHSASLVVFRKLL